MLLEGMAKTITAWETSTGIVVPMSVPFAMSLVTRLAGTKNKAKLQMHRYT